MRKNILKMTLAAAFVCAAGFTAYRAQTGAPELSGLALENVEALANDESKEWGYHIFPCNHSPYNECVYSESDRPTCPSPSYC